jgi:hypothetical protein
VADHPGAATDRPLLDRATVRIGEGRVQMGARDVEAVDVVQEAVERLADHR